MTKALFPFFLLTAVFAFAQVKLPRLISDGMILQRDADVKLWGCASPNEEITLLFDGKEYLTSADKNGKWLLKLPSRGAGGPFQLVFSASNRVVVNNVMFGDVWICSGQSNMELPMERVKDKYPQIVTNVNSPDIRQFLVPDKYAFEKRQEDVESGSWLGATKDHISQFSAVAFFFAKDLYDQYKVPIGLINSALGGSPAEAWISEEAIKKFPSHFNEAQRFKDKKLIEQIETTDKVRSQGWYEQLNTSDQGVRDHWSNEAVETKDWGSMNIPGYWHQFESKNINGAVWFRKEIQLPKSKIGKPARLILGRIVDADSVFINGNFVGTTSYQYPPRKYAIVANVLKQGTNVIAVRVISNSGRGGFVPDKTYTLIIDKDSLDLTGEWKYKLGAKMEAMLPSTVIRWKPVGLFNAMIAPLTNYSVKGVIWYQGESNVRNPEEYAPLMATLIEDWRANWSDPHLPFLFVQLPNFLEVKYLPSESNWAALRQKQLEMLSIPRTAMTVAIDLGEWNDIHPLNKMDVGKRLALNARKLVFNEKNIVASGPIYKSMKRKKNKLIIAFSNVGSGLISMDNSPLKYFALADADKKYQWAHAELKGNQVIVWNDSIADPLFVRYAWADNPLRANLYNKELLPASPFEAGLR